MDPSSNSEYLKTGVRADYGEKDDGNRKDKPPETPNQIYAEEEDIGEKRDGRRTDPVPLTP